MTARQVYSADWVLPVAGGPIPNGAVAVEDGRISAVGTTAQLGVGERFTDAVIAPGFVNAHTHLEYAVYAGFGDALPFPAWLELHIRRKERIGWDEMLAIARAGAAECLRSGVTTIGDASFSGAAAVAATDLGLRAIVYFEVFGRDTEQLVTRYEANRERVEHALSQRVRPGISPHAPYTCSPELYAACVELGLPLATHVSESQAEIDWVVRGDGPWQALAEFLPPPLGATGTRALAERGLLRPDTVFVHCVKVDAEEIDLLAAHDVAVAHCPRSNALLGCGIAPVAELLAAGVRVGLGTDSPASAPSFDVFDELRAAVSAARARTERADALTAAQALELATLGAARALRLEDELGSLEPGKRADLIAVSLADSPFLPWEDPAAALVLGGGAERVLLTMVDGEPRYRRGEYEWHELIGAARSARSRLLRLDATNPPT